MFDNPESVDIDGKEFQDLPSEIKHELLTEVKDFHRKRHKYKNATQYSLPEVQKRNYSRIVMTWS